MRALAIAVLLASSATAHAQAIFPAGGEVPGEPTIWVYAAEVPAISVHYANEPLGFEIDEMTLEHGIHRIAVRPHIYNPGDTFTVTAGRTHATYAVVDGSRHGVAADVPAIDVDFKRVSIVRRHGADILAIDAAVRHGTVMYIRTEGYLWVGEGVSPNTSLTYDPAGPLQPTRFEIPLAELGLSCASQGVAEFSPYTAGLNGGSVLYPFAKLQVDRGKIRLPVSLIGDFTDDLDQQPWLPCPGAMQEGKPLLPDPEPSAQAVVEPPDESPVLAVPQVAEPGLLETPADAASPREPAHDESELLEMLVVLLGALLVMWRATSRAFSSGGKAVS